MRVYAACVCWYFTFFVLLLRPMCDLYHVERLKYFTVEILEEIFWKRNEIYYQQWDYQKGKLKF